MYLARYIIITYIDTATHKCSDIIKEQEVKFERELEGHRKIVAAESGVR